MHPLHKAFTIGLAPLDPDDWIEVDGRLETCLAEKDRLHSEIADKVFAEDPETRASQQEILDLLADHLGRHFPETHVRDGNRMTINGSRHVDLRSGEPPLLLAAKLVQEDLVIMRRSDAGWRLAAASLCFPSSWSLAEKFGNPLHEIHAPVPGFGPGTRNAALIERIFDNLKVDQPVQRLNWGIYANADLYQPDRSAEHGVSGPGDAASCFFRIERQTLRRMPASGDILFTIRIHLDPLDALRTRPEAIGPFVDQLRCLDDAELGYKGLAGRRAELIAALADIAPA
jgi:hypothetical protein